MSDRSSRIERSTGETQLAVSLTLQSHGEFEGTSGIGFLDHMLCLFCHHSGIDLQLTASGDLGVDDHHLVEDLGIVLGQALLESLGDKRGLRRYGNTTLPMDEVLLVVALDLSGRYAFASNYAPVRETIGDFSTEMADHFFRSLALEARMALHFHYLNSGVNEHHRLEAQFKGFGRALAEAVQLDPARLDDIPSTKGVLEGS